jgi:hypothetical protein
MLEHSLAASLFGLLPTLLNLWWLVEADAWQVASGVLAAMFLVELLLQIARIKDYSLKGAPPRRFNTFIVGWIIPTVGFLILQVLNVVTWSRPLPYLLGVLWLLVAAAIQFLHFTALLGLKPDGSTTEAGTAAHRDVG